MGVPVVVVEYWVDVSGLVLEYSVDVLEVMVLEYSVSVSRAVSEYSVNVREVVVEYSDVGEVVEHGMS